MENLKEQVESQIKKYFKVGYYDTEPNKRVKDAFIMFCYDETDGNYLLGIKRLLESYSVDWKFDMLYGEINSLKLEIEQLKKEGNKEVVETKGIKTFGRGERK